MQTGPPAPPIPLAAPFCPSQTPTHQFCSSSSTSRVPSSSSRTRSRAGNPPCRRQQLQQDPPTPRIQPAALLRNAVTPSAVSPRGRPGDPPGPGVCPEGGRGRKGSPARPGPQEASPPSRAHCAGEGGPTEPDPPRGASCPVPRGGNAGETPNSSGAGWAFRPRRDGCRAQGGCPHPAESLPHQERRGRGVCWGSPSPQPHGCSETRGLGTGKGTLGGWQSAGSPHRAVTTPPRHGCPRAAGGAHLGRLCQAERPIVPQDARGDAPGVSRFRAALPRAVTYAGPRAAVSGHPVSPTPAQPPRATAWGQRGSRNGDSHTVPRWVPEHPQAGSTQGATSQQSHLEVTGGRGGDMERTPPARDGLPLPDLASAPSQPPSTTSSGTGKGWDARPD